MVALLGLLPILQAVAACFTIWGVAHTAGTADTVVHYGVGADGPSPAEWMNSVGSIVIGLAGFLATHVFAKQAGVKSEAMLALVAYLADRRDAAAQRRLGLAAIDLLETLFASNVKDSETATWWNTVLLQLRQQIVSHNVPAPPQAVQQTVATK